MEVYLLKILIAHITGDFFLQPSSWVREKEFRKMRSDKLYLHVAIHTALIFVVFADLNVWLLALTIGLLHLIIDSLKLLLQQENNKRIWFFADQVLHAGALLLCWNWFYDGTLDFGFLQSQSFLIVLTAVLFLTMPTAVIMRVIIAKWVPDALNATKSLQNAGQYIGILERLLIFVFICTNHFEAVGFLLAAKSVFRFGDLKEAHDIKLTEYVLIGTLLSFGIAIMVALATVSNVSLTIGDI